MKRKHEVKPQKVIYNEHIALVLDVLLVIANHAKYEVINSISKLCSVLASDDFLKQLKQERRYKLAVGESHYFLYNNTKIWGWGDNKQGQLGKHPKSNFKECVIALNPKETVLNICTNNDHSFFYTSKQRLLVGGRNTFGQLGLGHSNRVKPIVECNLNLTRDEKVLKIVSGYSHAMILTNNRVLACGSNLYGQLSVRHIITQNLFLECQLPLNDDEKAINVSLGLQCSFVLTSTNRLLACGDNSHGQLGEAPVKEVKLFKEVLVPLNPDEKIKSLYIGEKNSMISTSLNRLLVSGCNKSGELGLGDTQNRTAFTPCPLQLKPGEELLGLSNGPKNTLLYTSHFRLLFCGKTTQGQKQTSFCDYPLTLNPNETIISFKAKYNHSIFFTNQDRLFFSGCIKVGQLLGFISRDKPVFVPCNRINNTIASRGLVKNTAFYEQEEESEKTSRSLVVS